MTSTAAFRWVLLMVSALVLSTAVPATGQADAEPEEFSAFAIDMGRGSTGATAQLVINITRWTSQTERDRLLNLLREKGQRALIDAFGDTKRVGSIRTLHSVGYDLQLAYQEPAAEGRRRVLIATDRPIGFTEAVNRPPTMDYPFTVIELLVDKEGKGQGTLHIASRLVPAGKTIIVENWDIQPVQLRNVESRKRGR